MPRSVLSRTCPARFFNCPSVFDVELFIRQMSEFKFACPVCGQHITADSNASGKPLECPTCFQRIVAPQAPLSGDPKLILSATKAAAPPTSIGLEPPIRKSKLQSLKASLIPLSLLLVTGSLAFLLWHNQLTSLANGLAERATSPAAKPPQPTAFKSPHPIPANVNWTLNVATAPIPNGEVVGSVHGNGFLCEHASFKTGRLSLRQGPAGAPDLGITVSLGALQPEQVAGKAILVTPTNPVPAPRVVLRWKDDQEQPVTEHIRSGYAMKVIFGPAVSGRIQGRIFIALPDDQKSFAAGTFEAEITGPNQPLAGK
jgi:hypothetical protein